MDEISTVIQRSRRLEHLLKTHYHAEGKGLHQQISSCDERLPQPVVKKLRFIATMRNKVVHEEDFQLPNRKQFRRVCDDCEHALQPRSSRLMWRLVIGLIVLVTAASLLFYFHFWQTWIEAIWERL